ncbi:MAG: outer membrane protein [Chlorobi bacterium OLB5]|nr:MAG: outer membrane protein [Chlorobi bacterium OLB5]
MKYFKILILLLVVQAIVFSQNITNTLGTTGQFKIKDAVNTYFTLSQSNGYIEYAKSLKLQETTDLNTGVVYKGTSRFIHNYKNASNMGNNTFVGINSGNFTLGGGSFTNGSMNTGLGANTLSALTTGSWNTAIGYNSLVANTSGNYNTALGHFTLSLNTTGSFNIAIGGQSMYNSTSAVGNVAVGYYTLLNNITGGSNVVIGSNAMENNTSGSDNTAVGRNSLRDNETGFRNTAVGYSALILSLGAYNTAIGYDAGSIVTTGTNLTLIGNNAEPSSGTTQNQVTLGNNSVTSLRCNVQTITSLSDVRDKKNINELSLGLNFIMHLKPRQFNWDRREWYDNSASDGTKMEISPTAGFIAQELDSVQNEFNAEWLKLVLKDNPDKWEATYGNLLPVVVKAVQELKSENDRLKEENSVLAQEIEKLKNIEERIAKLENKLNKTESTKEIKNAGK